MNPTNFADSQPFGIGTRTEIRLGDARLLTLSVRAGDLLRSGGGLVWATVDGEADDILLERGNVHRVERDCEMRVSAFGPARLEVYGNGPLRYALPRPGRLQRLRTRVRQALAATLRPAPLSGRALGQPA
jgi:hypothetical protein